MSGRSSTHIVFYSDCPGVWGAEQINHGIMCGLAASGYRVTCVQSRASHHLIDARGRAGIGHVWIGADNLYHIAVTPRAFHDFTEPDRVFETTRPDLVIFGDGCPFSSLTAKETAGQLGIPHVIVEHLVDAAWTDRFAAQMERLPPVYRAASEVIAVSRENLTGLKLSFGLPADKGRVIYNGRPEVYFAETLPSERARLRDELAIGNDALVALTVARMELTKGYQYLLESMRLLREQTVWPRLYFLWVGSGTLEPRLRFLARAWGGDQVRFLGTRSDVPQLLDASDLVILPSQYEGMPVIVIEAMAKGLPVIASEVNGVPEALGDTGRLVSDPKVDDRATVRELAHAISTLAADRDLMTSMGQACRQRAQALFRESRMLAEYQDLVRDALTRRPTTSQERHGSSRAVAGGRSPDR